MSHRGNNCDHWSSWSLSPFTHWPLGYVVAILIVILVLEINNLGNSCEIALGWILQNSCDQSIWVQLMAWCRRATSHYLSQCWPRSMSPHDVTRPQWIEVLNTSSANKLANLICLRPMLWMYCLFPVEFYTTTLCRIYKKRIFLYWCDICSALYFIGILKIIYMRMLWPTFFTIINHCLGFRSWNNGTCCLSYYVLMYVVIQDTKSFLATELPWRVRYERVR